MLNTRTQHEDVIDKMISDDKSLDEITEYIDYLFECGAISYSTIDKLVVYTKRNINWKQKAS